MWHLKIPKIAHFYWGGEVLPFMRYVTIQSFMRFNPDWLVMLWTPKQLYKGITWKTFQLDYSVNCLDFSPELDSQMKKNIIDFSSIGFFNNIPENFKADYLRNYLLNTFGGIWSDMDIIYIKSVDNLAVNIPENNQKRTFLCYSDYGHSVGFLMSDSENKFFEEIRSKIIANFNLSRYQCIGPELFNRYIIDQFVNIRINSVYPFDANNVHLFFNKINEFDKNTIGLHWYAGNPIWGEFIKDTNGGFENLQDNIIGNLLKDEKQIYNNSHSL